MVLNMTFQPGMYSLAGFILDLKWQNKQGIIIAQWHPNKPAITEPLIEAYIRIATEKKENAFTLFGLVPCSYPGAHNSKSHPQTNALPKDALCKEKNSLKQFFMHIFLEIQLRGLLKIFNYKHVLNFS